MEGERERGGFGEFVLDGIGGLVGQALTGPVAVVAAAVVIAPFALVGWLVGGVEGRAAGILVGIAVVALGAIVACVLAVLVACGCIGVSVCAIARGWVLRRQLERLEQGVDVPRPGDGPDHHDHPGCAPAPDRSRLLQVAVRARRSWAAPTSDRSAGEPTHPRSLL